MTCKGNDGLALPAILYVFNSGQAGPCTHTDATSPPLVNPSNQLQPDLHCLDPRADVELLEKRDDPPVGADRDTSNAYRHSRR